ncbi:MAG: hypothetical protein NT129_04785 [Candidatus Aenigmarchaeota archaeon]|nr:hypothetical protein [Candidatus Aenigmarchaeota archaeon]
MSEIPVCCGKEMKINLETSRFIEIQCESCGDVIYVKKIDSQKPIMLDD